jgi:hypothetical protein
MAKITEIYQTYQNIPMLQLHQLRVAAVASIICDNQDQPVNKQTVVRALLVHDLANILKFDFSYNPILFEPEGVEHWKRVRDNIAKKYQTQDEHHATVAMAKELGMDDAVITCIEAISFDKAVENANGDNLEVKICSYSDMRVDPDGVVSLDKRLEEGNRRYRDRPDKWIEPGRKKELEKSLHNIENQIFAHSKIEPSDITNDAVAPIIEQLRAYEI